MCLHIDFSGIWIFYFIFQKIIFKYLGLRGLINCFGHTRRFVGTFSRVLFQTDEKLEIGSFIRRARREYGSRGIGKLLPQWSNHQKPCLNKPQISILIKLLFKNYVEQALQELGLGSIKNLKDYYLNDIVVYYRTTYDKVNKMYEAYKKSKMGLKPDGNTDLNLGSQMDTDQRETNHSDLEIDEFMKNNEL